ncbi:MAG: Hpt domain-containing protein [Pirellulales bacterium]|nr:Hpt domain-containing protein [Pirellulales bacterium]
MITTNALYSPLATDPDLSEIVAMFVEEMPERITMIHQLLDANDWQGLRRAAHQLKGSAGSHGFDALTPMAARVENAATGTDEEQIRRDVDQLIQMCTRVRAGIPQ